MNRGANKTWHAHSGDLGDLVYGLPAIKATGRATLYLFHIPNRTTHGMSEYRVKLIRPLLIQQPYIEDVVWCPNGHDDSNINGFRCHYRGDRNLSDMHLATLGLSSRERHAAWLEVDPLPTQSVVIHRSSRYQNDDFPWSKILDRYSGRIMMVGLPNEHADFVTKFGNVPYYGPCSDFWEMARIIKGADLFVGNQSCPAAIAEGLKQRMVLEVCRFYRNCNFDRMNRINAYGDGFELPELG